MSLARALWANRQTLLKACLALLAVSYLMLERHIYNQRQDSHSRSSRHLEFLEYEDINNHEEIEMPQEKSAPSTANRRPSSTPRVKFTEISRNPIRLVTPKPRPVEQVKFQEIPVLRAPPASHGELWPQPSQIRRIGKHILIQGNELDIVVMGKPCDILTKAVEKHRKLIQQLYTSASLPSDSNDPNIKIVRELPKLTKLEISIQGSCEKYPTENMDEYYELTLIDTQPGVLKANQVWGILRGLETFHQLIYRDTHYSNFDMFVVNGAIISDVPRFKHRGIMIDTSRHFLNKETILKNLEAMSMVKFNVLHWHIVDDQSFPYESKVFPNLTKQGAYRDDKGQPRFYSHEDIREIIDYAADRGVRVIPEFDTPGHTESWSKGLPEIMTRCLGHSAGFINPVSDLTFSKLELLFSEIRRLFIDKWLHLGGDECSYLCWSQSIPVGNYMLNNNMTDFRAVFGYFISRLGRVIAGIDESTVPVYWQEVFDEGVRPSGNAIFHIWKDQWIRALQNITQAGYQVIFSSCWYLNYVSYGTDWLQYYHCDPTEFVAQPKKHLILGGEACMWGEYVDDSNIFPYLWPRAIAVAERLWTMNPNMNYLTAVSRYEEQRCRFIRRGIPAAPSNGPGPPCA